MKAIGSRIGTGLFALFVTAALTFGGAQALSSPVSSNCGDDPHEIGTCPPLTNAECDEQCAAMEEFVGGQCMAGCCRCLR